MSCHGCASKFTLFTKENGCPSCGFSYCSKCLKYKAVVSKLGGKEYKICKSCYDAIMERKNVPGSTREEYCPPESFLNFDNVNSSHLLPLPNVPSDIQISVVDEIGSNGDTSDNEIIQESILRRLESLENPSRPPITVYRQDSRIQKLKAGLTEADRDIVERLEKLKEERKKEPVPSEEEVARRLSALKGEDPERTGADKKNYVAPDTRSSQEKADSLIEQYTEETELEKRQPDPADEIAERLAKLRGLDTSSVPSAAGESKISNVDSGNSVGDCEEFLDTSPVDDISALMEQLKKETNQDVKEPNRPPKSIKIHGLTHNKRPNCVLSKSTFIDDFLFFEFINFLEELPWCIICNEDASVRCVDCDNDLYCKSCFKQGHDEWEFKNHKTVPYTPKGKSN
ncbi:hypothetical protein L9F63_002471 [Diploptera punctata]|uniref:FYVE-type domain-containing protein n=1 Tax=Diploptera punctata TaxID=6984 RepID=A0AAD7ZS42_DIPPU|nr:hypothetical protein L9F63_002471 [Diploptera punctata]